MTSLEASLLYIGLGVLFLLLLKVNVARVRVGQKVEFGDQGNEPLLRAIRVQGNAVEDMPIVLLGLLGIGMTDAPVLLIHGLGAGFLIFRLAHAIGLSGSSGTSAGRAVGTLGSALIMLVTFGACMWFALT